MSNAVGIKCLQINIGPFGQKERVIEKKYKATINVIESNIFGLDTVFIKRLQLI